MGKKISKTEEHIEDVLDEAEKLVTEKTMKDTNYNHLLREWTKRLGLTDWRIKLKTNCHPDDMPTDGVGSTSFTETTKCAHIYILSPLFYGERIVPFDGEEFLVHELLHLKLALIQDVENDLQERYVHQLLDDIARALVDAKRAKHV